MAAPFAHLHVHSEYSLLDGASRIGDLAKRAAELEIPALALTDHGVMYGAIDFYKACQDAGVHPLLGCEVYVAARSRHDKESQDRGNCHLTLLAETADGYRNLIRMVSQAHLEGFYYKPRVDEELLSQYGEGLIAMSACLQGAVAQAALENGVEAAEREAAKLRDLFGPDRFYLELMDHNLPEQPRVNALVREVGSRLGIPVVATNDAHYLRREDAEAHDILLCMQTQTTLDDPGRMRFGSEEFYLKSPAEMAALFPDCPEAIANTMEVAQRCRVELQLDQLMLPHFEVPEGYDLASYLRHLCEEALPRRYGTPVPPAAVERLNYELEVIETCRYSGYFLIVADFVREAKRRGMLVGPGRGSAAGSIVSYLLGIVDVDPLRFGLLFERMLNPERVSPPDIDMDFPDDRRREILDYVTEKYGRDQVAQVGTFNTLGARAAIRDVGRVLGVPLDLVDRTAKLVPGAKSTIAEALEQVPELQTLAREEPQVARVLDLAARLEGVARHVSVHAAAVVISDRTLTDYVPLRGDRDGVVCTQYAMDPVVRVGLVKMDFLGLKTLTVISRALEMIKQNHGVEIDLDNLTLDDPATYELLSRGDTVAVFQLESDGMRQLLRELQPGRFEHIIALVALYRPGPMQYAPDFCAGRHGALVEYLDPRLKPILEETYGVILYQEQVMQIAQAIAGFSMPQSEIIMRAMLKKQAEKMEQMKPLFLAGCVEHGLSETTARVLYERMEAFSRYAFNKSHSAGYALVAYWTAYLKAHYPAEFMAAHLSTVMDKSEEVALAVGEARRMGLRVLPPSINRSQAQFGVEGGALTFGLGAIKNFGLQSAEAIVAEREANGPYKGLGDFCRRLPSDKLTRAALKLLIEAGALDEFGERAALLAVHEQAVSAGQRWQQDQAVGRISLFGETQEQPNEAPLSEPTLPDVPAMTDEQKLEMERQILGLYVSAHPLEKNAERVGRCTTARLEDLEEFPTGAPVAVAGLVEEARRHLTKNGDLMMYAVLQGVVGRVDVTIFRSSYDHCVDVLTPGRLVVVTGKVERRSNGDGNGNGSGSAGAAKLICDRAYPLESAPVVSKKARERAAAERKAYQEAKNQPPPPPPKAVFIELDALAMTPEHLRDLGQTIERYPGYQEVVLRYLGEGRERRVALGKRYRVNNQSDFPIRARQIEAVLGIYEEKGPAAIMQDTTVLAGSPGPGGYEEE